MCLRVGVMDLSHNFLIVSNRLFGPNHIILTSKIALYKRKFWRPSNRTVQYYGWGTQFWIFQMDGSHMYPLDIVHFYSVEPSIWTDPKLCIWHFSLNLNQHLFRQSKITLVGSNFEPSKSTVVERNFGPSKITVVDCNFGSSKTTIVDRFLDRPKLWLWTIF